MTGAADVRAFDVRIDLAGLEVVGTQIGNLLGDYSQADALVQHAGSQIIFASAQRGRNTETFAGNGIAAVLSLRALEAGRPQMMLAEGTVVNAGFDTQMTGLDNSAVLPVGYSLGAAYPNPFNPVTTIQFAMPVDGFARLTVYNMLGQSVRQLVMQDMTAGRHQVTWDATNQQGIQVASGVYVYQLEVNDFKQAQKMILLK